MPTPTSHARRLLPTRPPVALCAAAFALVMAACGVQPVPSPSPSATPAPSPSPNASASTAEAPCAAASLEVTGGPWGGAAGSRGSDIQVRNTSQELCVLPAGPSVALVDQAGAVLLSTPPQAGPGPQLAPGSSSTFSLVMGNWCNQDASLPLHFSLALAGESMDVAGLSVTTVDDLPPCNGPDQPATLTTTSWQPG